MRRATWIPVALFVCAMMAATGCRHNEPSRPEESRVPDGQALETRLAADPDVHTLIAIRDDLTARALGGGVTERELMPVLRARDEKSFAALLGMTENEYADMSRRLAGARARLLDRYPELTRGGTAHECPDCDVERFGAVYRRMRTTVRTERPPKPVTCRWVPYAASLTLCTGLGPWLYWPCATVALCSFCEGGWVDSFCQN